MDECAILSPRLGETLAKLRTLVAGKTLSAIDEIEAFADAADEKILLNLSSERLSESPESIASALRAALPWVESILVQDRRADKFELFGPGYLPYSVGGMDFRVGHLSFLSFSNASARHSGSISFALARAARPCRARSAASRRRARDADAAQKTRALAHQLSLLRSRHVGARSGGAGGWPGRTWPL